MHRHATHRRSRETFADLQLTDVQAGTNVAASAQKNSLSDKERNEGNTQVKKNNAKNPIFSNVSVSKRTAGFVTFILSWKLYGAHLRAYGKRRKPSSSVRQTCERSTHCLSRISGSFQRRVFPYSLRVLAAGSFFFRCLREPNSQDERKRRRAAGRESSTPETEVS